MKVTIEISEKMANEIIEKSGLKREHQTPAINRLIVQTQIEEFLYYVAEFETVSTSIVRGK